MCRSDTLRMHPAAESRLKLGSGEIQVLNRLAKVLLHVTVLAAMGASAALAQTPPKTKQVKDQAEYDLYKSATTTADASKRLPILNTWKEKYPESDFKEERLLIYLTTYQALNQPAKMVETAQEILAMNPKEPHALLALTLLTATYPNPPTADSLALGEKAAAGLLEADKPAEVKDDATWKKIKTDEVHKARVFIAMARKQPEGAEQEYVKWLAESPEQAHISYGLGNTILAEKKQERREEREGVHLSERSFGTFQRLLRLPFQVDAERVQARFENGVLHVSLPKTAPQERSRRIQVQAGGGKQAPTIDQNSSQGGVGNPRGTS